MAYVLRSNTSGIISEFLPNEGSNTTIILLDGLPSNISCKRDIMQKLASFGVSSIAPRYKGTRESEGEFLDHNPAYDIKEIIDTIRNGEFIDLYNNISYKLPSNKIIVLGVSFGGLVVLDCLNHIDENFKIILVSPLCDIVKFAHNLGDIKNFVKNGFGRAYNFSLENWDNMINGNLFETDYSLIKQKSNQISLIYDDKDKSILESDLLEFCKNTGINDIVKINGYGHLSYSKWDDKIYNTIGNII